MTRVVRLNDETIKLMEEYKKILERDFTMETYKIMNNVLKRDNIILQSALMFAINFHND